MIKLSFSKCVKQGVNVQRVTDIAATMMQRDASLSEKAALIAAAAYIRDEFKGYEQQIYREVEQAFEQAPAAMKQRQRETDVPLDDVEIASPILQNRDRTTVASIAQMQAIAAAPNYGLASGSRTLSEGAPVVIDEANIPEHHKGRVDYAIDAMHKRYTVRYAVVEAKQLLTSHSADGTLHASYAEGKAGKLRVLAGNGRVAGFQAAYNRYTAGQYRKELLADLINHDIELNNVLGIQQPVLVRLMRKGDVTADMGDRTNTTGVSSLNAVEQAKNDATRISFEAFEFNDNGQPTLDSIKRFVQSMPAPEQSGLLDSKGQAGTQQAVDRLMAALFYKAYGSEELVRLYAQDMDAEAKNVLNALAMSAGDMAALDGAGDLDIRDIVAEAAGMAVNASRQSTSLTNYLATVDMDASPDAVIVAQVFADTIRSAKRMAERLRDAARFAAAEASKGDFDLFGEVVRATRADVLNRLRGNNGNQQQRAENLAEQGRHGAIGGDAERHGGAGDSKQQRGGTGTTGIERGRADSDANTNTNTTRLSGDNNAPSTDTRLERDSKNADAQDTGNGQTVRDGRRHANGDTGSTGARAKSTGDGARNNRSNPIDPAAIDRERGNQPLPATEQSALPTELPAGVNDSERGGDDSNSGIHDDTRTSAATQRLVEARNNAPATTNGVILADLDNIAATLPILTSGQRGDVVFAEKRLADNKGVLFTNGTGTGKTFTALGIIKRFALQGKTNTIVVVPSVNIADQWIKAGTHFDLTVTALKNTQDSGKGLVITTYANFGANHALFSREWDLVVVDESHKLMSSEKAELTHAIATMRGLTYHNRGFLRWFKAKYADVREAYSAAQAAFNGVDRQKGTPEYHAFEAANQALHAARQQAQADYEALATSATGKSKRVVMLSATPFAYVKAIDYAEGYLFDYGSEKQSMAYNAPSSQEAFFMRHFGYRMRYNKLTRPDAKVDNGVMERQFNAWLRSTGALSYRGLDVDFDYDRKFIHTESTIGRRIDEALEWIRESKSDHLAEALKKSFNYLPRRYLLEGIKAAASIPVIEAHLALGRKVVVFHDYNKGGVTNPFRFPTSAKPEDNAQIAAFNARFGDLVNAFGRIPSPIDALTNHFGDRVMIYNGSVPAKERIKLAKAFNDDDSGKNIILVQSASAKEGVSFHDTTGKHPRVLLNLGLPTQPTTAIQQEGRIYRVGQASHAMFRYFNTGTHWERWAFASTIADRASTAENLAAGEGARALKDAFIDGFEASDDYPAGFDGEGTGGKAADKARTEALSEYDRAKTLYYAQQKKTARTKSAEGADYYATPEPVGYIMAQIADARAGDDMLEPSAGHGAIARWFRNDAKKTAIEPSGELSSRLALVFDGDIKRQDFESLHIVNKYDVIVMNPPFGKGGKTAIEHLDKAAKHLRENGRIVALLPSGSMADKRLEKWLYESEKKPLKPLATVNGVAVYKGDTATAKKNDGTEFKGVVEDVIDDGIAIAGKTQGLFGRALIFNLDQVMSIEPTGKRFTETRQSEGLHLLADIQLPHCTFERAGTQVKTHIVVIDRLSDAVAKNRQTQTRDYSDIDDINALFDRIENLSIAPRNVVDIEQAPAAKPTYQPRGATAQADKAALQAEQAAQASGVIAASSAEARFERRGDKIVTDAPAVEITTKKGKQLTGVFVKDEAMARAVDPFTYCPNGKAAGWFVRLRHVERPSGDTDVRMSASPFGATGSTVAHITSLLPKRLKRLIDAGHLRVVQSASDLPAHVQAADGVEGLFDGQQTIYLVADRLNKGNLQAVLSHELYHRGLKTDASLQAAHARFEQDLARRFTLAGQGIGSQAEKNAHARVKAADTPTQHQTEEFAAYLITDYLSNPHLLSKVVQRLIADLVASIRAFLVRNGLDMGFIKSLTPADLVALSRYGARVQQSEAATVATIATHGNEKTASVATVASVAVANGAESINPKSRVSGEQSRVSGEQSRVSGEQSRVSGAIEEIGESPKRLSTQEREAARQYREIEQRYFNADGSEKPRAMLAPNGKRSKLNKNQWIQVRTQAFKDWFGDWEAVANLDFIDRGNVVAETTLDRVPHLGTTSSLLDWIANDWVSRGMQTVTRTDIGAVTLDRRSAKDSFKHGVSRFKIQAFYVVPDVLEKGVLLGSLPQEDNKPRAMLIAAPIKIGDQTFKAYVEVRKDVNMQRMYVHEVVLRDSDSTTAFKSTAATHKEAEPHGASRGAIYNFISNLRNVNASKVVDENGEPLVVYHGTADDVESFDLDHPNRHDSGWLGKGVYTTTSSEIASSYSNIKAGMGDPNVMPLYVSLQNPYLATIKDKQRLQTISHNQGKAAGQAASEQWANELKAQGYNGVILEYPESMVGKSQESKEIVIFAPTQIKSATGNNGDFSATNADIRYSKASTLKAPPLLAPNGKRSKLNKNQWIQVRMQAFKDWFGDWENDPANASKVVDENGEPLVVYHVTKADFSVFDVSKSKRAAFGAGFYFAVNPNSQRMQGIVEGSTYMPVYLNIKQPASLADVRSAMDEIGYGNYSADQQVQRGKAITENLKSKGFDGADIDGDWLVFDPTQIKSATGNNGDFSAANADIRYSKSSPILNAREKLAELTTEDALDKVLYEMQDKYIDLKRLREHIESIGGQIDALNDAYDGETLYHERRAKRIRDFERDEIKPLLAGLRLIGVSLDDFERYLHARHAPEANAHYAEINPTADEIAAKLATLTGLLEMAENFLSAAEAKGAPTKDFEKAIRDLNQELGRWRRAKPFTGTQEERNRLSGMSNAEAATIIRDVPMGKRKALEDLARKIDAINAKTLDLMKRYGLETGATVKAWGEQYAHYVPLHRDEAHSSKASHPIGQGFNVRGSTVKQRTGSTAKVTHILSHVAMQREQVITRGEKNRVMQQLYLMAKQNPLPEYWSTTAVPTENVVGQDGFVETRVVPYYKNAPNVVMLRVAGKDVAVVFNDKNERAVRLALSMKNQDVDDLHFIIPMIGRGTRWLSSINTQYNPVFGAINLLRDLQGAGLNLQSTALAGQQAAVYKATLAILKPIAQNGLRIPKTGDVADLFNDFQQVGGSTGYSRSFYEAEDREKAIRKLMASDDKNQAHKAFDSAMQWLSDYNEALENAVRLGAYQVALANGLSKEKAAVLAKDLTVNFNRKGRQARELSALYGFFNANVQGTARLAETLTSPSGKKIMLGLVAIGALQTLFGMLMGGGEDDWEAIPEHIKARGLVFPLGNGDYLSVPMALGFHIFPNMGRFAVESVMRGGKDMTERMVKLSNVLADTFNPVGGGDFVQAIMPTVLDPLIALYSNNDWTGAPVYLEDRDKNDPTPGFTRTKATASPFGKAVAEVVNGATGGTDYTPGRFSPTPDQIDYVIGQLTGGAGREALKLTEVLGNTAQGEPTPANKIPLLGRFYGSTNSVSGQADRFYANIIKANGYENEIKGRIAKGQDYTAYAEAHPKALEAMVLGNNAEKAVKGMNAYRRSLIDQGNKAEAKAVEGRIVDAMKAFNSAMAQVEE